MAGRNFRSNRIYNWHVFGAHLDARATIGSTGAVTLVSSSTVPSSVPAATQQQSVGIKSITRLGVGTYRIQLDDNYASLYSFNCDFLSLTTGSDIAVDSTTAGLSVGTAYQITAVGTATTAANYVTLGVPSGITPAVGVTFVALTTGTGTQSGAGTVKAITNTGSFRTQVLGIPDLMLNNQPFVQGSGGGYITFQVLGETFTGGSTTTGATSGGTPAGTVSAPTFTGDALATHTHTIPVTAGTAGDAVTNNAGTLESTGGQDLTTSATSGGTPAGTNSAPTFTGSALATHTHTNTATGTVAWSPVDPTSGTTMYIKALLGNSALS